MAIETTNPSDALSVEALHAAPSANGEAIRIRGARVHNLADIDIEIPRNRLIVLTGPSGSGKSSLAVDTLCAEGQRQYVESLSIYARQFLNQMERPDVDLIEGLQPTIAIDQRAGSPNPRSTVGTVTEIYDYLRLLYARLGVPHCHQCGQAISQQTPEQILQRVLELPPDSKAMILAPIVRGRRGAHKEALAEIRKAGFVRARIDGVVYDIDEVPKLVPARRHDIEAVVDRVVLREGIESRLAESIDLALAHGEDQVIVCYLSRDGNTTTKRATKTKKTKKEASGRKKSGKRTSGTANRTSGGRKGGKEDPPWQDLLFSTRYACTHCGISFQELEPRTFSFNSPYGACPECDGLGYRVQFDPDSVLPDWNLSLAEGAVVPWKGLKGPTLRKVRASVEPYLAVHQLDWDSSLATLTPKAREKFLEGTGGKRGNFLGVFNLLEKEYSTTTRQSRLTRLEAFRSAVTCPACQGARLRPEARSTLIDGKAISDLARMSIEKTRGFFDRLKLPRRDKPIYEPIVAEIQSRLLFLQKVGAQYLSLDRSADSLSGGELQRVRLATGIGSGLVGVCYILDEPSIGLHPCDNQRLIDALRELQALGNTVLVVEHDEAMMRASDELIDMGPGAGIHGGKIVVQAPPDEVSRHPDSVTGKYLSGRMVIPIPKHRRRIAKTRSLLIEGVTTNNLKDISVRVPLSAFVCVTGVSGSGKSSLVNETLVPALARRLDLTAPRPGPHRSLRGAAHLDKLVPIDQSPLGRTPRSNPATYTGVFDEIRRVFAGTREARKRGYGAGRFSFNVKGGRCEDCQGQGQKKIEMNFLPDLYVTCDECRGQRFNRQTLEVRYRERSIADVLQMQVEEALEFFENFATITRLLGCLQDVGLGYVTLGQPSNTLSGGEAQRVKLATELARLETGRTLYVLDEPTTGLHFDDIRMLLGVLMRLVEQKNTVLVIEHNLDVIKCADWLIDLGPEGGEAGGHVMATGIPEEIAAIEENQTGRYLKRVLVPA